MTALKSRTLSSWDLLNRGIHLTPGAILRALSPQVEFGGAKRALPSGLNQLLTFLSHPTGTIGVATFWGQKKKSAGNNVDSGVTV